MASIIRRLGVRNYSTPGKLPRSHKGDLEAGVKLWEKMTYFVALPATVIALANFFLNPPHHERPEFIPYDHLRIHNKRFPWGDGKHTLFHNKHLNALPDGYED